MLFRSDWVSGWYNAPDTLNISYSEGGFQLDLEVIPYGRWNTPTPSNINILVAITNTGGISVAYSYQGPQYPNLRTGVRLNNGSIVSLEQWGATQVQPGSSTPTLSADPVVVGPTQEQLAVQEEMRVTANLIANAIATASIQTEPSPEPSPVQTQQAEPSVTPTPQTTVAPEPTPAPSPAPTVQPSPMPSPQPTDIIPSPTPTPMPSPVEPSPEPSSDTTTEPEVVVVDPEVITPTDPRFPDTPQEKETDNLLKQLADLTSKDTLAQLTPEQKSAVSKTLGIKSDEIALVAELAKKDPIVANALATFTEKAKENADAPMPYTLADAIVEEKMNALISDPGTVLKDMFNISDINLSKLGSDMTDDQREKAQEVIIPVILVSNIVSSVMSLRRL